MSQRKCNFLCNVPILVAINKALFLHTKQPTCLYEKTDYGNKLSVKLFSYSSP